MIDVFMRCLWGLVVIFACQSLVAADRQRFQRPNIVYIMSDELAYFEVGYMGHPQLKTPRIDRMAREGLMFTNALAGSPVCAPLRCTLMTGKHSGHSSVRRNDGGTPLRAEEPTIASMLQSAGYSTGGFGKWGCGGRGSTGVPEQHGFDIFCCAEKSRNFAAVQAFRRTIPRGRKSGNLCRSSASLAS